MPGQRRQVGVGRRRAAMGAVLTALMLTACAPGGVPQSPPPTATATGGSSASLRFATDTVPLRNARATVDYEARIDGLVFGDRDGLSFTMTDGPDWVTVSEDGAVTGTPPADAGDDSVSVTAENAAGATAEAVLDIEVRAEGDDLVPEPSIMSMNMWVGGTNVEDSLEKEVRFLLDSDVDIVGFQEATDDAARPLADALGWDYHRSSDDIAFVSRYPIAARGENAEDTGLKGSSITVRLDDERGTDVVVWDAHLDPEPYGPYDACFGELPLDRLLAMEDESGRPAQMQAIVDAMGPDLEGASQAQVILTGDMNAPSHLDWTADADRCGYDEGVPWPSSTIPVAAGLVDTFREVHPDPLAEPGLTWSPVYLTFTGGYGYDDRTGEPEPQDRIDFVYAVGPWEVVSSETLVVGDPTPIPDAADNEWTSDHRAVRTVFRLP